MAANPSGADRLKLSPEDAKLLIQAIEDVEREEAEAQDLSTDSDESTNAKAA